MAKYDPIPDQHSIMRWVKRKFLPTDDSGNVIVDGEGRLPYVYPAAYMLRDGEEYLSVTWIEHFGSDAPENWRKAAEAFRQSTESKNIPKSSCFCSSTTSAVIAKCAEHNAKVRVLSEPVDGNQGHAGIFRFPLDNAQLSDALANQVFIDRRSYASLI